MASCAPMVAVEIANGQVKNGKWSDADRAEIPAEMVKFGALPREILPDENRIDAPVTLRQLGNEHATVETAADQSTDGPFHLLCRTTSFSVSSLLRSF